MGPHGPDGGEWVLEALMRVAPAPCGELLDAAQVGTISH